MRHKHHFGGLSALLLLGVFAVCVLVVLLTGAEAYQRLNQRDRAAYDTRTPLSTSPPSCGRRTGWTA